MKICYTIYFIFLSILIFRPEAYAQELIINEFMSSNATTASDEDGDYPDWIELYNASSEAINLNGYFISDSYNNLGKWTFPEIIIQPGGFLLIWASGKDRTENHDQLHTNFSISASGEELLLSDPEGNKIDKIEPVAVQTDVSYGRFPDGSENFRFFLQPTPGAPNSNTGFSGIASSPVFSNPSGFYSGSINLTLSSQEENSTIVYTTDGSEPSMQHLNGKIFTYKMEYPVAPGSSPAPLLEKRNYTYVYSGPIEISDRSNDENRVSAIPSTLSNPSEYMPDGPVPKATVVKARVYKEGMLPGPVVTHTYFVGESFQNKHSVPVISLSLEEGDLMSHSNGIYVAGETFDNWRLNNPNAQGDAFSPANYNRRGEDWERPSHFEYFLPDGSLALSQNLGIRIHGAISRSLPMKSIRLYARGSYGENRINYKFFKGLEFDSFNRLILRNSGNDFQFTMFRDAAIQRALSHMNFDTQAYQPAVLYINGEYWGIHNIRERYDKHYLERVYGVDPDQVDILEFNMSVVEGDAQHYAATIQYIEQNGLSDDEHYEYIQTRIDVDNFTDYNIAQIFSGNNDWPGNNMKYWRAKVSEFNPNAPAGQDGRWRWLLFDMDFGFALWWNGAYEVDMLTFATNDSGNDWPNPAWATFLFRKLLENETFKSNFINRFTDQLNTAFKPEPLQNIINELKDGISPEMANHIERWKNPSSQAQWDNNVNSMLNYANRRHEFVREHIREYFSLGNDVDIELNVNDIAGGFLKINTVEINNRSAGLSEMSFPWTGTYFQNHPISLEAIPMPGFQFSHWEGDIESEDAIIEFSPVADVSVRAVFQRTSNLADLIHYWNFNNTGQLLEPSFSLIGGSEIKTEVTDGSDAEITFATGQGFNAFNARFDDPASSHLRVNNPLGGSLYFHMPTNNFSDIIFSYETRRSGQGAGTQVIEYSIDGENFTEHSRITVFNDDPEFIQIDFSDLAQVNENPNFVVKIHFEQGEGGIAGNNRFDNITLEGTPTGEINLPPVVVGAPERLFLIENDDALILQANDIFQDPEEDELTFSVSTDFDGLVQLSIDNGQLNIVPLQRGEAQITLTVTDGNTPSVSTTFPLLIYPAAVSLENQNFQFSAWSADQPEMTFPDHMIFLQSDINDPGIDHPLNFAYFIPEDEYNEDDEQSIGFPYNNTRRTRINGFGVNGISFINTGRERDLGGALTAVNTTAVDDIQLQWTAATILQNQRVYGLQLQYRIGTEGSFNNVEGAFYRVAEDDDEQIIGPVSLPAEAMGQEYVQLMWRYHHIEGNSGPRAELRLDDIVVATKTGVPALQANVLAESVQFSWTEPLRAQSYQLQVAENVNFTDPIVDVDGINQNQFISVVPERGNKYFARVRAFNAFLGGDWSDVLEFDNIITSLLDGGMLAQISVFPNPFEGRFQMSLHTEVPVHLSAVLYDITGKQRMQLLSSEAIHGEKTIDFDLSHLTQGTYILVCNMNDEQKQFRLVKY